MECTFLRGTSTHRLCKASMRLYTPVMEDYQQYCSREGHRDCPIFLDHTLRQTHREDVGVAAP